jgi:hypothetical protein
VYGFLQLCADRRFHRLTMQEFEGEAGLGESDYWIEAAAGGAPGWDENTLTARFAYDQGARVMGWAAHGDHCGGFPGVSNDEMRQKVERSMQQRAEEFPEAEHIALFATEAGVEVVARQAARGKRD